MEEPHKITVEITLHPFLFLAPQQIEAIKNAIVYDADVRIRRFFTDGFDIKAEIK